MVTAPTKYPFFSLISNRDQAELTVSVLTVFGSEKEKQILLPEAHKIQSELLDTDEKGSFVAAINDLLSTYLELYGEFSDELTIFLSRSLMDRKLATRD